MLPQLKSPYEVRLPEDWSIQWLPAIPLPWEFPEEITRSAIDSYVLLKYSQKAAHSASARAAHEARRQRRAANDYSQQEDTQLQEA